MVHRPATGVDVTDDETDPALSGRGKPGSGRGKPGSGRGKTASAPSGTAASAANVGVAIASDSAGSSDDSAIATVPDGATLAAEAVRLAGDDQDLADLVATYWRFAPDEELVDLSPGAMLAAVRAHRHLAEQRLPGELKLDVGPAADGDTTIIQIVVDDMPFLVDSVNAALAARGLDVHLLVHPLIVVSREPLGRLVEVHADVECDDASAGQLVGSWLAVVV